MIHNVRVWAHATYTRVVFDLQRPIPFTQTRRNNPNRLLIDLTSSTLGTPAKATLRDSSFPPALTVTQISARTVRITLQLDQLRDYKFFPLNSPARLVVDLVPYARQRGSPQLNSTHPPGGIHIHTIMIDPGHGGKDPGALGRKGTREKAVTLGIAKHLKTLITTRLHKKVLMTRDRDTFVDLETRANLANKSDADLFVSIHANSHPKRKISGLEVYHFGEASDRRALEVAARENGTPLENTGAGWEYLVADLLTTKKVEDSLELAWTTKEAMIKHLTRRYKIKDHGVKTAPFYVLRFTTMPSILAEVGFISNPTEEKRMRTNSYQQRMAEAIFHGLQAYIKSTETHS